MTDHRDIVEAFVDAEPVEAAELSAALADADARAHLLDVLVLRGLIGDARPMPAAGVVAAARAPRWGLKLAAAAAVVAASLTGGFAVGRSMPAASQARNTAIVVSGDQNAAPAPTHVIRLENGVEWNERSGGN